MSYLQSRTSDITLVNLPSPFLEDALQIYPLGILNIYTQLKKSCKVELMDLNHLININDGNLLLKVLGALRHVTSPVIGVSCTTSQARFLPLFPALNRWGKVARLVAGGPHATHCPDEILKLGFNLVIQGEGENSLNKIFRGEGAIVGKPVEDLDYLPLPDRTAVYGYKGPTPIMAGRGCPFSCVFCANSGSKVRWRSPDNVVEEILSIKGDDIIFYDDTFTMNPNWVSSLCSLILKKKIKKRFRCSTRADRLDKEMAVMLKAAGFDEVCVGVESGSNQILKTLEKRATVEKNTAVRKVCLDAGLKFKAFIMLGSPGETGHTIQETIKWLDENKPDSLGLYMFVPLPGCKVWNNKNTFDIDFSKSDLEGGYYGGKREDMVSKVSTSSLTRQQITKHYWDMLERYNGGLICSKKVYSG